MSDFIFRPPWPTGAVFTEASTDRITRIDRRTGCFAVRNTAWVIETVLVTMGVRIMTPPLIRPFRFIHVETDSTGTGMVSAGALPGYARGRVEARVRVLDTSMRVLSDPEPIADNFFRSVTVPFFYGLGLPFSRTVFADTMLFGPDAPAPLSAFGVSGPLIVEVRINSWAIAYGNASATADIANACVTAIHVFTS